MTLSNIFIIHHLVSSYGQKYLFLVLMELHSSTRITKYYMEPGYFERSHRRRVGICWGSTIQHPSPLRLRKRRGKRGRGVLVSGAPANLA